MKRAMIGLGPSRPPRATPRCRGWYTTVRTRRIRPTWRPKRSAILSIRDDKAEESQRIVEPILGA